MQALNEMKQKGRALRKHLEATFGNEVSLSQAYEALAAMEGAENWNVLSASLAATVAPQANALAPAERSLPPIRAIFRTVDDKGVAEFDASSWFAQAGKEAIARLMEERPAMAPVGYELSYGGLGGASDSVAEFCAANSEDLKKVYAYIQGLDAVGQWCGGSDCYVDAHDVQRWLGARSSTPEAVPQRTDLSAEESGKIANLLKAIEVNLVDVLNEYDAPDDVPEWAWVEQHHSFAHKGNGIESGIWEYMVNVERIRINHVEIPEYIRPFFERAEQEGAAWVMFHQG